MVDLAGTFSKLSRVLARMTTMHSAIRARTAPFGPSAGVRTRQQFRVSEEALVSAEARYLGGATLRELAPIVGVSRQRLGSLLRSRGVRLRRTSPSEHEVEEMVRRYEAGESLAAVGSRLGFDGGTVRNWLIERGVRMRDSHRRERQPRSSRGRRVANPEAEHARNGDPVS